MFYALADGRITPITRHIKWDIEGVSHSARRHAARGAGQRRGPRRTCCSSTATPSTSCRRPRCRRAASARAQIPSAPAACWRSRSTAARARARSARSTRPTARSSRGPAPYAPAGVDTARFAEQQIVRWKSFDGREISGFVYLPPARFTGKRPVLIDIHGGPEGQARPGFIGRNNYFVDELGIARDPSRTCAARPATARPSSSSTTACKREDSVKDIGALLDWIATQPRPRRRRACWSPAAATAAT